MYYFQTCLLEMFTHSGKSQSEIWDTIELRVIKHNEYLGTDNISQYLSEIRALMG